MLARFSLEPYDKSFGKNNASIYGLKGLLTLEKAWTTYKEKNGLIGNLEGNAWKTIRNKNVKNHFKTMF